jgi:hypothetical protein
VLGFWLAESPGPRVKGGSAMEEPGRRLAYVFVFECETCKRDVFAFFPTDKSELDFHLRCACGWEGTRRGTQAKRVLCQDSDSPLPKA